MDFFLPFLLSRCSRQGSLGIHMEADCYLAPLEDGKNPTDFEVGTQPSFQMDFTAGSPKNIHVDVICSLMAVIPS